MDGLRSEENSSDGEAIPSGQSVGLQTSQAKLEKSSYTLSEDNTMQNLYDTRNFVSQTVLTETDVRSFALDSRTKSVLCCGFFSEN